MKNKEIVFVDDDNAHCKVWMDILRSKGLACRIIRDATEAYDYLVEADDLGVVVLDIMLSARHPGRQQRYSAEQTNDYMTTGLVLFNEVSSLRGDRFSKKVILFTHTDKKLTITKARGIAKEHGINFIRKKELNGPYDMIARVLAAYNGGGN